MAITTTGMSTVGVLLEYLGTPEAIVEVFSISGPSYSQTAVDTTHHTSASRFRTYVPGMSDGGELNFDIRYIPTKTSHDATLGLVSLLGATDTTDFRLTFPDNGPSTNTRMDFKGIVTSFTPSADLDSSLDASVTVKITGVITYTEAT